jgi:uncharacterized protein (DUF952 family)
MVLSPDAPDRPTDPTLHLLTVGAWAIARGLGVVAPASLANEGFVHCTRGWTNLVDTANRHYAGAPGRFLALTLDVERLRIPWRYDDAAGLYPHVYGPLPLSAIVAVRTMPRSADGRFLPISEVDVNALEPLLDRLSSAGARLAATRQAVEDGAPWPVGAAAAGGGEGEWGPTEILAHVSELLPFWLGELERVLAGADGHGNGIATFGRNAGDQVRGLTIVRDATLPVRELYDRIAAALQRYRWRVPELTAEDIARVGALPSGDQVAVPDVLERFAVSHLEEHARQLTETLATRPRTGH